jgi:hypothetical protein
VIPFQVTPHAMIVSAVINGRDTAQLLFDTGWRATTLDAEYVTRLGLRRVMSQRSENGMYQLEADSLRLGGWVGVNVPIRVRSILGITPPGQPPVQGVLGASFLENQVVRLDFERNVIEVLPPQWQPDPGDNAVVRSIQLVSRLGNVPLIDSVVVGGRPLRGLIDSGAGLRFMLTPAAARMFALSDTGRTGRARGYGGGATHQATVKIITVAQISLGTLVFDSPEVVVASPALTTMNQPPNAFGVVLGLDFLRQHRVIFDYPSRRVTFAPLSRPTKRAGRGQRP